MAQSESNASEVSKVSAVPRSVLIAGCGYVGHRAALRWAASGVNVFAITRSTEKARQLADEKIQAVVMDLSAPAQWPVLPDVDVVLWSVGFDRSSGADRRAIWIDGLRQLLMSLPVRKLPRRILYTSSTGVYGDGGGNDVDENTKPMPVTEGGQACLEAENLLRTLAESGKIDAVILRLAGIYGPDRLLRRVSELRTGTPLTSAPDDWLNLIHVDDAVAVIELMARLTKLPSPTSINNTVSANVLTANVVSGNSVTRRTYYEELARQVNAAPPVFTASIPEPEAGVPRVRGRSGNRRVISILREHLDVRFRFDDVQEGLRDAVNRSQS